MIVKARALLLSIAATAALLFCGCAGVVEVDTGDFERATVVRVVDGDTIIVNEDGREARVRLVGIDAPESVNPDEEKNCAEGEKASDYLKSSLPVGQTVYLQFDIGHEDKYERELRYVWLDVPSDALDEEEVRTKMLNARIIEDGYACAMRYEPNVLYYEVFRALQLDAMANARGVSHIWQ